MVMPSSIKTQVLELLFVFLIAVGVGVFVAKMGRFPYTVALLLAGLEQPPIQYGHGSVQFFHLV